DLKVVVVRPWQQRRARVERETPLGERTVLGTVRRMLAQIGGPRRAAGARLGRRRRKPAVRRIGDERGPNASVHRREGAAALEPVVVVRASQVGVGAAVPAVAVVALQRLPDPGLGLLARDERLVAQLSR